MKKQFKKIQSVFRQMNIGFPTMKVKKKNILTPNMIIQNVAFKEEIRRSGPILSTLHLT